MIRVLVLKIFPDLFRRSRFGLEGRGLEERGRDPCSSLQVVLVSETERDGGEEAGVTPTASKGTRNKESTANSLPVNAVPLAERQSLRARPHQFRLVSFQSTKQISRNNQIRATKEKGRKKNRRL